MALSDLSIQNEEERGRIMGKNGLTLRAFQILISQSVFHKFNQRVYVSLDIGNYLKKKDEQMKKKAQEAIRKVKESGEKVVFEPMNASERRIIHMTVKEETGVKSSSDGEGRERFVTIELDEYVAT